MSADIFSLNQKFKALSPLERIEALFEHYPNDKVLVTSSFGSTSALLLHMISKVKPDLPVYFIDTGYHFEETIAYKKQLSELLNIRIADVKAEERKFRFTYENETWRFNQDLCCSINKVSPIEELRAAHEVWVSGLLGFQNANRSNKDIFEPKADILKFYPLIDMAQEEVSLYMKLYDLPVHELVRKGYDSIGCTHCTAQGRGREGRWINSGKTECGLHL